MSSTRWIDRRRRQAVGLVSSVALSVLAAAVPGFAGAGGHTGAAGAGAPTGAAPATRPPAAPTSVRCVGWCPAPAYLQPVTRLTPAGGGRLLTRGWTGVKVSLIQRALGMGSRWEVYDAATISRVRAFQARRALKVDGVVGPATWRAARISVAWTVDGWQTRIAVPSTATRAHRVTALTRFATAQVGAPYTWGGAGYARLGYDCSGLVLQSLYAAGVDPQPVSVVRHQAPGYVTTEHLYRHARVQRVRLAQRQRGDLVFWGRRGVTTHVAIYLGGGRVVEAVQPRVRVSAYAATRGRATVMPYVVRPLADR